MREIPLTKGKVALVDDEDYERLSAHSWHYLKDRKNQTGYATRAIYMPSTGSNRTVYMHREIVGAQTGEVVDHANHDGLDNRRCNLRKCTPRQNGGKSLLCESNKTGFKGVTRRWSKQSGEVFLAQMPQIDGKRLTPRRYATAEDAARAYDAAARVAFGEFAKLNFPDDGPTKKEQFGRSWAKSRYRGVYPQSGGYMVSIRRKYVGFYKDALTAARRYDDEARRIYGDKAKLNFPEVIASPSRPAPSPTTTEAA